MTRVGRFAEFNGPMWQVTGANGLFVSVEEQGRRVATSPDGVQWADQGQIGPSGFQAGGICWSPELGLFVIVGSKFPASQAAFTSTDGVQWIGAGGDFSNYAWQAVVWSAALNLFLAVSTNTELDGTGYTMTSPDGVTWTLRSVPASYLAATDVVWSAELGLFCMVGNVVGGDESSSKVSSDGVAWQAYVPTFLQQTVSKVCWDAATGLFSAQGTPLQGSSGLMESTDGLNWSERQIGIICTGTFPTTPPYAEFAFAPLLANPARVWVDSSGNGRDMIGSGLAPSLVASPWGGAFANAAQFSPTSGWLSKLDADLIFLNASPFTLDAKVSLVTVGAAAQFIASVWTSSGAAENYALYVTNTGFHAAWRTNAGAFRQLDSGAVAAGPHDARMEFDSGTMRLLVDGAVVASMAGTSLRTSVTAGTKFAVGGDSNGADRATGIIVEEVRVSNIARNSGAYVPATVPFVADANTRGLWHLDSAADWP